jgi:hypothetical protein
MTQGSWTLISEAERAAYGDEVLSVMARKAQEVVQPAMRDMERQTQQLRHELQKVKAQDVYSVLDQNMPNWREINVSREFVLWLQGYRPYSNQPKSVLLRNAFDSGDAGRVLTIFRGFLGDTQQPASIARTPRMSVDNSSATITNADIDAFYDRVRRGFYEGKDKQKAAEEAQIHRAILEGRLRRTTP